MGQAHHQSAQTCHTLDRIECRVFVAWLHNIIHRQIGLERGENDLNRNRCANATLGIALAAIISGKSDGLSDMALPSAAYGVLMYVVTASFVVWYRRT